VHLRSQARNSDVIARRREGGIDADIARSRRLPPQAGNDWLRFRRIERHPLLELFSVASRSIASERVLNPIKQFGRQVLGVVCGGHQQTRSREVRCFEPAARRNPGPCIAATISTKMTSGKSWRKNVRNDVSKTETSTWNNYDKSININILMDTETRR
jgi:hypothetical protein